MKDLWPKNVQMNLQHGNKMESADFSGPKVQSMVSFIRNVSFDCADPYALASFWAGVVGHPVHPDCAPGDEEVAIEPSEGPRLYFQAVPEPKTLKNRVHVCLQPDDRPRDAEIDRLLALGAVLAADHRRADGSGWVVLLDPAGNEFCVTRSSGDS
jgi:hypothetical protein